MSKSKYSSELKTKIVKAYEAQEGSYASLSQEFGVGITTIKTWVRKYRKHGTPGLIPRSSNASYSSDFKLKCVKMFLRGDCSLNDIATKYNISSIGVLHRWIACYNANKELKDYNPNQEVYMADTRRKTTPEERKEITEYCLAHNKDYKGTAALYSVSYSQVYDWVRKYISEGEEGLTDKRGHRKADNELDELECLRRENQRLKRQLEDEQRTVALLKKVNELERM